MSTSRPFPRPTSWLLLRGLGREARHWGQLPALLQAQTGAKAFTLDLPGFGQARDRRPRLRMSSLVEDLRARWRSTSRPGGPVGLLAISLGGMVALRWCARYPADFSQLVIINSSAGGLSPPHHRMQLSAVRAVLKAGATNDVLQRETQILELTSNLADIPSVAEAWARVAEVDPPSRLAAASQLLAALAFRRPAPLSIPVLVVSSLQDRLVESRCSLALAEHLKADLVRHPTAGHDLPLDDPAWLVQEVRRWQDRSPSSPEAAG